MGGPTVSARGECYVVRTLRDVAKNRLALEQALGLGEVNVAGSGRWPVTARDKQLDDGSLVEDAAPGGRLEPLGLTSCLELVFIQPHAGSGRGRPEV